MFDGPALWFLNRGTGIVLLLLVTLSVVLGLQSSVGRAGRGVPRFVSQHLHRNVGLLSAAMMAVHVVAAVADTYVTISWWEAFVPFMGGYRPLWLGLGALALDLTLAVIVTSLLRRRLPQTWWRGIHLLTYIGWGAAVVHGIGIGTDAATPWSLWLYLGCVAAVGATWLLRQGAVLIGWATR